MTATYEQRTPAQVKRLAGAEYQNLRDDLSWAREEWSYLIELIQVNPYEPGESSDCEDIPVQERDSLARRWAKAFDLGQHAQQAENRRKGTVA